MAALPQEIWAASMTVFFQDLSVTDQGLSWSVEWVKPMASQWETNSCELLSELTILVSPSCPPELHPRFLGLSLHS